jgi:acylphosphatase
MSDNLKIKLIISGKVQGVGFRNFVLLEAQKRKLEGFTRNLRSGDVEVVFSGGTSIKTEFIERLRIGPPLAQVTGIIEENSSDIIPLQFQIYPTV